MPIDQITNETDQPNFWIEIGCFALFMVGMLVTCGAVSLMAWSVVVPHHGHITAFHVVCTVLILIHGAVTGVIVLQFPWWIASQSTDGKDQRLPLNQKDEARNPKPKAHQLRT